MTWILLPIALAAGIALPVQFGVNSHLKRLCSCRGPKE
jgi:uncharacterized membrane protein YdcZ (DUF606 family)